MKTLALVAHLRLKRSSWRQDLHILPPSHLHTSNYISHSLN